MKMKMLSLGGALALCLMALTAAEAAPYNCAKAEYLCKSGCSCALFECYPDEGYSICSCPIWCPEES
ncbi:MAG TPA: hypothetical protein VIW92_05925 [Thermoanaerobaculia bacterium]